jgi:hypothetical protein
MAVTATVGALVSPLRHVAATDAPVPTAVAEGVEPDLDPEPELERGPDPEGETVPLDAGENATLHVRFAVDATPETLVGAMETLRGLLRERPGSTRVVIHVPSAGDGSALPMELRRGVAYDSELLAEVNRRLGEGVVDLSLA